MLHAQIDHLSVTASTLAAGIDDDVQALGVTPLAGGAHARMGTHNCLLKLGENMFLAVIAVNPAQPATGAARLIALIDTPGGLRQLGA